MLFIFDLFTTGGADGASGGSKEGADCYRCLYLSPLHHLYSSLSSSFVFMSLIISII
jgi:hypothetical protein